MPMNRISRAEAISKTEFHRRLREWLKTEEHRIGPEGVFGKTKWIHVKEGSNLFGLDVDTKWQAVDRYLQTVVLHGEDLQWQVAENVRGNMTAVIYGPERLRIKPFYLYFIKSFRS